MSFICAWTVVYLDRHTGRNKIWHRQTLSITRNYFKKYLRNLLDNEYTFIYPLYFAHFITITIMATHIWVPVPSWASEFRYSHDFWQIWTVFDLKMFTQLKPDLDYHTLIIYSTKHGLECRILLWMQMKDFLGEVFCLFLPLNHLRMASVKNTVAV